MKVEKIEFAENQTIVSLSIENQTDKGYFCADKNIYLLDVQSKIKYKLIESKNIPVCPETFYFNTIGEVLHFQLYFPNLKPDAKYINIVEDCKEGCFSINGIILDKDLNQDIDLGFENYAKGNIDLALFCMKKAIENHPDYSFGILYTSIIQIYAEKNDFVNAKSWYKKLSDSNVLDKPDAINRLKHFSFYTKLIF